MPFKDPERMRQARRESAARRRAAARATAQTSSKPAPVPPGPSDGHALAPSGALVAVRRIQVGADRFREAGEAVPEASAWSPELVQRMLQTDILRAVNAPGRCSYVAVKRLKIGEDQWAEPGDELPIADTWPHPSRYLSQGLIARNPLASVPVI